MLKNRYTACLLAIAWTATLVSVLAPSPAAAQPRDFPNHPITLVVPYGPGGVVDLTARDLAEGLSELLHKPVVLENRPGAAGAIAAASVARAKGDGYTLLYTDDGVLASMPHFNANLTYHTLTALKAVSSTGTYAYVVLANSGAPFKTLDELVQQARANPGRISFATNGIGSTHHLAWERFERQAGIKMNHVPYKSGGPALQDVIAGHVPVMTVAVGTLLPMISDKRVVPFATLGSHRTDLLPNVPTTQELGYGEFSATGWLGVFAPATTPDPIVRSLASSIAQVVNGQRFRDNMQQRGGQAEAMSPADLGARLRKEYEKNGDDIRTMGIQSN